MDDWKLHTRPVVRLERPKKTFACLTVKYKQVYIPVVKYVCFTCSVDVC